MTCLSRGNIPVFRNPEMMFCCVKVDMKGPFHSRATSLIEILLPGLEWIHDVWLLANTFLYGPNTATSSGCNAWEQYGGNVRRICRFPWQMRLLDSLGGYNDCPMSLTQDQISYTSRNHGSVVVIWRSWTPSSNSIRGSVQYIPSDRHCTLLVWFFSSDKCKRVEQYFQ